MSSAVIAALLLLTVLFTCAVSNHQARLSLLIKPVAPKFEVQIRGDTVAPKQLGVRDRYLKFE